MVILDCTRVFMLPNKLKYPRAKDLKPKNFMKMIDIRRSSDFDRMPFWHFHFHGSLFKASVPRIVIALQVLNYDKYTS